MKHYIRHILLGPVLALMTAVPTTAFAATSTLYAVPLHSDLICQGEELVMDILLDADQAINAAEIDLTFDPAFIQVTDVAVYPDSIFIFWPEGPEFDNEAGTIHMIGGLPTPGFIGTGALIARVYLTPTGTGTMSLEFQPTVRVLLNDGLGTGTEVTAINSTITVTGSNDPACSGTTATDSNSDVQSAQNEVSDTESQTEDSATDEEVMTVVFSSDSDVEIDEQWSYQRLFTDSVIFEFFGGVGGWFAWIK